MEESSTIDEFCAAEKISRSFFYKLEAQGKAPKTYPVGRVRRISPAAREAWRAACEADFVDDAARKAGPRKAAAASKAARISATPNAA